MLVSLFLFIVKWNEKLNSWGSFKILLGLSSNQFLYFEDQLNHELFKRLDRHFSKLVDYFIFFWDFYLFIFLFWGGGGFSAQVSCNSSQLIGRHYTVTNDFLFNVDSPTWFIDWKFAWLVNFVAADWFSSTNWGSLVGAMELHHASTTNCYLVAFK